MVSTFGTDEELCMRIVDRCTGDNQQFDTKDDCMEYMDTLPMHKMGYCPALSGNTKACRWTHTYLTIEELRPEIHCFHVGPHIKDPNGYTKCTDATCEDHPHYVGIYFHTTIIIMLLVPFLIGFWKVLRRYGKRIGGVTIVDISRVFKPSSGTDRVLSHTIRTKSSITSPRERHTHHVENSILPLLLVVIIVRCLWLVFDISIL
eukprot:UN26579